MDGYRRELYSSWNMKLKNTLLYCIIYCNVLNQSNCAVSFQQIYCRQAIKKCILHCMRRNAVIGFYDSSQALIRAMEGLELMSRLLHWCNYRKGDDNASSKVVKDISLQSPVVSAIAEAWAGKNVHEIWNKPNFPNWNCRDFFYFANVYLESDIKDCTCQQLVRIPRIRDR